MVYWGTIGAGVVVVISNIGGAGGPTVGGGAGALMTGSNKVSLEPNRVSLGGLGLELWSKPKYDLGSLLKLMII